MYKLKKTTVAIIAPWPPLQSGIAEYAYELVKVLAKDDSLDLHLYTNAENPSQIQNVTFHQIPIIKHEEAKSSTWWELLKKCIPSQKVRSYLKLAVLNLKDFILGRKNISDEVKPSWTHSPEFKNLTDSILANDHIIYHFGNNPQHSQFIDLFAVTKGHVHLHDFTLHHLFVHYYFQELRSPQQYFQKFISLYPSFSLKELKRRTIQKPIWDSDDVNTYSFTEAIVANAETCIVHSQSSKNKIQTIYPDKKVFQIPLFMGEFPKRKGNFLEKEKISFGIFGHITPNKQLKLILHTLAILDKKYKNWSLEIIGKVERESLDIYDEIKKLKLQSKIKIHGRVEKKDFLQKFLELDYCINLRNPTMGETSAVAANCLQIGLPMVVTNHGSYAELPNIVDKLNLENQENELHSLLHSLLSDPKVLLKKQKEAAEFADTLSYDAYGNQYTKIIKQMTHAF